MKIGKVYIILMGVLYFCILFESHVDIGVMDIL